MTKSLDDTLTASAHAMTSAIKSLPAVTPRGGASRVASAAGVSSR